MLTDGYFYSGSFDSTVHISEEAANAAHAVPWAIVYAIGASGVLGWGMLYYLTNVFFLKPTVLESAAINVALAFCMGTDLQSLVNSNQPMAQILLNAFGLRPTLAVWAIVIIVQ